MKANNGSGNIPERDEWRTPKELYIELNNQYNFGFDCCANSRNSKTKVFSDNFQNEYDVVGTVWMNPPFSKAKEMFKHFFNVVLHGVAIYRCDNLETEIWQKIILPYCDWVFIPKGRVVYEGMEGNGSRFPSALVGVGVKSPKFIDGWKLVIRRK